LDRFFATELESRAVVDIKGPQLLELPHLWHLHTTLKTQLPPHSHFDSELDERLVQCLHPSSALGLRSKVLPWQWLQCLKGHQALGHFGAPIGLSLGEQGYFCLVGIRNLEWSKGQACIRAGCGIVQQSDPEKEWQELRAKRDSVKSLLGFKPFSSPR
jgi:menaquinone-specific isochorismate synthase